MIIASGINNTSTSAPTPEQFDDRAMPPAEQRLDLGNGGDTC